MMRLATCTAIVLIGASAARAAAPATPPPVAAPQAQTAAAAAAAAAASAAVTAATTTPWIITFNVQLDVSKIDAANKTVGLDCVAKTTFQSWLTAQSFKAGTVDAATYHDWIVAHPQWVPYRTASTSAPLVNGEYHGLQTVTFKMSPLDAAEHTPTASVDAVVVGCRLLLNVTTGAIGVVQSQAIAWQAP